MEASISKVYTALKRMRELSADNIPFSFSHFTYNDTDKTTKGIRKVKRAVLRTGLSQEHSDKSEWLIAYFDLDKNVNRFAYLPLIMTFNQNRLQ